MEQDSREPIAVEMSDPSDNVSSTPRKGSSSELTSKLSFKIPAFLKHFVIVVALTSFQPNADSYIQGH